MSMTSRCSSHLVRKWQLTLLFLPRKFHGQRGPADKWIKNLWYIYIVEYYSAIKRNTFESVLMRWMNLKPIIQSEISQIEKVKYCILMCVCGI